MRSSLALLLQAMVWLLASSVCQAAWTLPKGDSQLIVHAEHYAPDSYFDQGRTARSLGSNGEYTKESLSVSGEYGLRDRWMLFASPSAHRLFEFTVFELPSLQGAHATTPSFGTNPTQGIDFDRTRLQLQSVYWRCAGGASACSVLSRPA